MDALSLLNLMLPSLAVCALMVGMLSYLGIHVIKRQIIFVDLALAQIAALGTLLGLVLGIPLHTLGSNLYAVALTTIAAAMFSIFHVRESRVPQEALIGLAYAIAAGTTILIIDKAPHGAEHIKDILTGSILWVKWSTVGRVALVYAVVGLFHYVFRRKFLLISEDVNRAIASGMHVRTWDFLFYLSFGLVITATVGTAGVLLIFVFLVTPAVMALLITPNLGRQLAIGWSLGLTATVVGLFVSYLGDLSSGPMVIAAYATALIVVGILVSIRHASDRARAVRTTALTTLAFALAFLALIAVGHRIGHRYGHEHHVSEASLPGERDLTGTAETGGAGTQDLESGRAGAATAGEAVSAAEAAAESNPAARAEAILTALRRDREAGAAMAVAFLETDPPLLFAQQVVSAVDSLMAAPSGYDVMQPSTGEANRAALRRIRDAFGLEETR